MFGIFIFHRDLRIEDNKALERACELAKEKDCKILPLFIFSPDQVSDKNKYKSNHSIQFMINSLMSLDKALRSEGSKLICCYGDNKKVIGDFCKNTYKVEFPMVTKTSVAGTNANPLHKQLIQKTGMAPSWNFYKYVILPGGEKVYAFSSDVKPNSAEIMSLLNPYIK